MQRRQPDVSRINKLLELQLRRSFDEILLSLINCYRKVGEEAEEVSCFLTSRIWPECRSPDQVAVA